MTVNLGDKPLAGFGQPIEMLKDCHRRIEHFLDVLGKVERRYGTSDLDEEGRRALEAALNYFSNFAPRHTADEEQSLFPRLRRSEDPNAQTVMADLDRLENDHRQCDALHGLVDQLVRHWLTSGRVDEDQRSRMRRAIDELTSIYADHIKFEETRVFTAATHILTATDVREMGDEMRKRRTPNP